MKPKLERGVVVRGFVALLGGYAVAGVCSAAVARILPWSAVDASLFATMASFPIHAATAVYAFAACNLVRVLLMLILTSGMAGVIIWISAQ
ncbi:hypothetical protein [Stenotrophomonas sp. NRRL B-14846]|uniref:hypothetical protein n=1 Tax=Stenotrophomonas sp. NRRL B-14846 TaxID=3162882 RepID=UPI003D2B40CC